MGFFGGKQQEPNRQMLPDNIVSVLERFGRYEWDWQANSMSTEELGSLMGGLYPVASADPDGFLQALAEAALPLGGWVVYGASRLIWELLSPGQGSSISQNPSYRAIMDSAIEFLRGNGVPPVRVRGYEWDYWLSKGGTNVNWLPRIRTPSREEAPISELRPSEIRRVVQITPQPDSNVILVRQKDDGQYGALIDGKYSDEDPRRTLWEWKSAASMYELYVEIGLSQQTPPYWYDKELEPYFPLPRPKI